MYKLFFTQYAEKFLKKLNKSEREKILHKVYSIRNDPIPHLKRLSGSKFWRLRIDKYRAVLDIIVTEKSIIVTSIGHRKNVYDK